MRRLIFINRFFHPDHSATSQILCDLTFALASEGYEVEVLTGRQLYDHSSAELPAEEVINGVHVHRVWASRLGRGHLLRRAVDYLTFYLSATAKLRQLAKRRSIIIAETDPPLISIPAALVARFRRAKLVNWTQDLFPEIAVELGVPGIKLIAPLLRILRNGSLASAAANVALGEGMAVRLRQEGAPEKSIHVVHNWSPVEEEPLAATSALRTAWNLDGKFVVGYSGNFGRAHDFTTVMEAATLLREVADIQFLFVGDGAQRGWLHEQAAARKLDNITFQPYQPLDRLAESLAVPNVHLVSLKPELEGLIVPSKFYSVLATGRPVLYVGDTQGEMAKRIAEASCGACVAPGAAAELAAIIRKLASDPPQVTAMGRRARRLWEQQFKRQQAIEAWKKVLAGVAE